MYRLPLVTLLLCLHPIFILSSYRHPIIRSRYHSINVSASAPYLSTYTPSSSCYFPAFPLLLSLFLLQISVLSPYRHPVTSPPLLSKSFTTDTLCFLSLSFTFHSIFVLSPHRHPITLPRLCSINLSPPPPSVPAAARHPFVHRAGRGTKVWPRGGTEAD